MPPIVAIDLMVVRHDCVSRGSGRRRKVKPLSIMTKHSSLLSSLLCCKLTGLFLWLSFGTTKF